MAPLSKGQLYDCITVERASASLSVVSTLTMFTVFWRFPRFRTLSNNLLFFASFANLGANVAALIGGSALSQTHSALCQIQGFLLEWFMQSDPMWGTCMALNVYLCLFKRWDSQRLKKNFKWYILICYGVPWLPAMFCLWYRTKTKGRMYGNATLWCWIDTDWQAVRIYSYYAPIWCYILVTFMIYIRVGYEIFRKRSALRAFTSGDYTHNTLASQSGGTAKNRSSWTGSTHTSQSRLDGRQSLQSDRPPPFTGIRTTEVQVTSMSNTLLSPARAHTRPERVQQPGNFVKITTSIEEDRRRSICDVPRGWLSSFRARLARIDRVKLAYTKCAMLFACSILVTWIPASANRVYGLIYPKDPSFALNLAAAAVLPLQGFWNAMIFFWTSWSTVKDEWRHWRAHKINTHRRERNKSISGPTINMAERGPGAGGIFTGGYKDEESESMREVLENDREISPVGSPDYTRNNSVSERATSSG